mmetsp:Transcript_32398/g.74058  ORF Transcript_32398/g.74058 Transcript_32398/m.74058 type:complete len:299 (+) Transcript_32398:144-1040(+)
MSLPVIHEYGPSMPYLSGLSETSKMSPYTESNFRSLSQPNCANCCAVHSPTALRKLRGSATPFGRGSERWPSLICNPWFSCAVYCEVVGADGHESCLPSFAYWARNCPKTKSLVFSLSAGAGIRIRRLPPPPSLEGLEVSLYFPAKMSSTSCLFSTILTSTSFFFRRSASSRFWSLLRLFSTSGSSFLGCGGCCGCCCCLGGLFSNDDDFCFDLLGPSAPSGWRLVEVFPASLLGMEMSKEARSVAMLVPAHPCNLCSLSGGPSSCPSVRSSTPGSASLADATICGHGHASPMSSSST